MTEQRATNPKTTDKRRKNMTAESLKKLHTLLNDHNINLLTVNDEGEVTIDCRVCGQKESVAASNLLRRKIFCSFCSPRSSYSTEDIKQLIENYGGIYVAGEVTNRDSVITMICRCGKQVEKRAQDIRRTRSGCKHCKGTRIRTTKLQDGNNLLRAQAVATERGGRCLSDGLISSNDKIQWECSFGHQWQSTFNSVVHQGTWCPECNNSIAENLCRAIMEKSFDALFIKQRPDFLEKKELDGYNEDLKLAFECNGKQHYELSAKYHKTREDLIGQQRRDKEKQVKCIQQGVTLISIPYKVIEAGVQATKNFFHLEFKKMGIVPKHDPRQITIEPADIYDRRRQSDFVRFQRVVANKGTFDPANYIGLSRPLPITCGRCNHTWSPFPWSILKGTWCPSCNGNIAKTPEDISAALQPFGWSLMIDTENYQNAHQKLSVACPQGHVHIRNWNKLQQQIKNGGPSCDQCNKEQNALGFIARMASRGFTMRTDIDSYRGEGQKIEGICQRCGKTPSLLVQQWKTKALTPCCGERMNDFEHITA